VKYVYAFTFTVMKKILYQCNVIQEKPIISYRPKFQLKYPVSHHSELTFCLAMFDNKPSLNVEIAYSDFPLENIPIPHLSWVWPGQG